jgi:hypothetical protein
MKIDLLLHIRKGNPLNKEQLFYNSKQSEVSTGLWLLAQFSGQPIYTIFKVKEFQETLEDGTKRLPQNVA